MAVDLETTQSVSPTGIEPVYIAASVNTHDIPNDGEVFILIKNGGGGTTVATVVSTATEGVAGHAVADLTVPVPTGEEREFGPFESHIYNDASGNLNLSFDVLTSVTFSVRRMLRVN